MRKRGIERTAVLGLLLVLVFVTLSSLGGTRAQAQQEKPAAPPPAAASGGATAKDQNPQQPAEGAKQPPLVTTTGLVHLVVTVTDKHHGFVTDLDKSDFKVLENGAPQEIRFFGRETDLPLRIAMLLDTSNSIRSRLDFEKDAATDFLTRVIRRNKDMALLMTFDNEPEVIQDFTGDLSLLTSAIREQRAGGGTALNDAIYLASEKLLHAPQPKDGGDEVRRVVVLISDGNDDLSDRALSDAIDASIRSEAAVYSVSTNTDWISEDNPGKPEKYLKDAGDKVLEQFADQTGGQVFFPYRIDDLAQSFQDIGDELRSQYYIAYSPSVPATGGEYRKIQVETDRKGLIVRTRKGYYAVASSPQGAQ